MAGSELSPNPMRATFQRLIKERSIPYSRNFLSERPPLSILRLYVESTGPRCKHKDKNKFNPPSSSSRPAFPFPTAQPSSSRSRALSSHQSTFNLPSSIKRRSVSSCESLMLYRATGPFRATSGTPWTRFRIGCDRLKFNGQPCSLLQTRRVSDDGVSYGS